MKNSALLLVALSAACMSEIDDSDLGSASEEGRHHPTASGLEIATPLALEPVNPTLGQTQRGTVTYRNRSRSPVTVYAIVVAERPPGGTNLGGPWLDMTPQAEAQTVQPGASVTLSALRTFTGSDPTGAWYAFPTYQDAQGWHDGPSVPFT